MKYIYELMIENYARWTCLLQSPSSEICIRLKDIKQNIQEYTDGFNPLDRGNWYQINPLVEQYLHFFNQGFQSPRSGKFVSDLGFQDEIPVAE